MALARRWAGRAGKRDPSGLAGLEASASPILRMDSGLTFKVDIGLRALCALRQEREMLALG